MGSKALQLPVKGKNGIPTAHSPPRLYKDTIKSGDIWVERWLSSGITNEITAKCNSKSNIDTSLLKVTLTMVRNFKDQRSFEATLSSSEAKRAIYIDFEGFENKEPTFIGVRIDDHFTQLIFDIDLDLAARSHNLKVVDGKNYLTSLIKKAETENRRIIGFSSHEKMVLKTFFHLDIDHLYADARFLAKYLRKTVLKNIDKKPRDLTSYLYALNYPKTDNAIKKTTSRIGSLKKMLLDKKLKYGQNAFEECTPTVKAKWTKVLNHNNDDVNGMAFLVEQYIKEISINK
jgi:hypothetical protein